MKGAKDEKKGKPLD